jgi:Zn-dependent protease with chaperone function
MSLAALGTALALGAYAVASTLGCAISVAGWRSLPLLVPTASPAVRSQLLFALRVLPPVLGAAVAGLLLLAFLLFEPRESVEPVGVPLLLLALLGGALLVTGARRAAHGARVSSRVARSWRARGRERALGARGETAVVFDWAFPVVSLFGWRRPHLFVERRLLEAFDADELDAVLRHESAHARGRDNLKRSVMRSCPDVLGATPLSRRLEKDWSEAAEAAADDAASAGGAGQRLALASAIVKLARMATPLPCPVPGSAAYDGAPVASRVSRLLDDGDAIAPLAAPSLALVSTPLALAVLWGLGQLRQIHELIERAVAFLG